MSDPIAAFRAVYETEHARTRKVLNAYPADQASFKPHERSNDALTLGKTFVIEEKLMLRALQNEQVIGTGGFPAVADDWSGMLAEFESQHEAVMKQLGAVTADSLQTVKFFSGPKQMADYVATDFLWFLLHDQIHHRGQLTVYLRMVGGKVPAIYGPSADEPWT
jgi:uncharacterized damage-inducible protein DinB